jgi:damage-control phosphatase, subfamily I
VKLLPECYLCAMRQALAAARLVSGDEDFHHECMVETARLLAVAQRDMTPPEGGEEFYRMIRERSGNPDPFREQKRKQNEVVEALLPWLRETVSSAEDPLLMAVRLAIAGNAVDPGAQESFDLEKSVMEAVEGEAGLEAFPALAERLESAGTVLVIADNCGEVVFDRVLIETMRERAARAGRDLEVILAVRAEPIINDVTMVEADELGMCEICTVISSGSGMPGTVLGRTTTEFREAFDRADLVISKGQGNWETLEDCDREVFFLFQAKCPAVAAINHCREGQPLLLNSGAPEY